MRRWGLPVSVWPESANQGRRALLAAGVLPLLAGGCGGTSHPATAAAPGTSAGGSYLVVRGKELYVADGCSGCHSLDGTRMTGPSWRGLAGSRVTLSDGRTLTADDAYLRRHIIEPNALTVRGYPADVMAEATESLNLPRKPFDVRALVAFIDSVR